MFEPSKVYNWLLGLYPAQFREDYRGPMERQFRDDYRDATTRSERIRVLANAAADLATSLPAQLARECLQDLRHATHLYRKGAGSTILAIVALGFAIGASTGVFSVLNALLLRSLPFTQPDRLVEVLETSFNAMRGRAAFHEWQTRSE